MSLWVDKYRPSSLAKLDYHKNLAAHLKKLVRYEYLVFFPKIPIIHKVC